MAPAAKILSQLLHITIPYLLLNEEAIERQLSYASETIFYFEAVALISEVTHLVKILP